MARVRSRNTRPEMAIRSVLWSRGLRYRLGVTLLKTKPDVVFLRQKVAVFIDGCFWHGCPDHYTKPRSRETYWAEKFLQNVMRDCRQTSELESAGWRVVRIWEREAWTDLDGAVDRIAQVVEDGASLRSSPDWRTVDVRPAPWAGNGFEARTMCRLREPSIRRCVEGPRVAGRGRPHNPPR